MIWIIISIFIAFIYVFCIFGAYLGWQKTSNYHPNKQVKQSLVSVLVAFRNEEKNLSHLLRCLSLQTYANVEFILVNDHSTDEFSAFFSDSNPNLFRCINAKGFGKKNAIREGIEQAKGKLIVCTDADCLPSAKWIETIHSFWQENHSDIVICPVKLVHNNSLFQQLQSLEFISLIASGIGFAGIKMPIMCNGANIAFTKKQWLKSKNDLQENKASGDDMFLLLSAKRQKAKIDVLKSENALIETSAQKSFKDFFNQRKRWASKNTSYNDWQVNTVSAIVFFTCFILLTSATISLFSPLFLYPTTILFLSKLFADTFFLSRVIPFFKEKSLLRYIPLLSLLYPFYIVTTAISGIFGNFDWKGRKF